MSLIRLLSQNALLQNTELPFGSHVSSISVCVCVNHSNTRWAGGTISHECWVRQEKLDIENVLHLFPWHLRRETQSRVTVGDLEHRQKCPANRIIDVARSCGL